MKQDEVASQKEVENKEVKKESELSKFFKKHSKNPRSVGVAAVILLFAIVGAHYLFSSFAATASLSKIWQTSSDWNSGTLSSAAVVGNSVKLAPANTSSPTTDIALNQPVTASSVTSDSSGNVLKAAYAVDGSTTTRWSSGFTDPSWIYVNLGKSYNITEVKINWELAYGTSYQVQTSTNATSWTTVWSTITGKGGIVDITGLKATGQYVRIYGTKRNSQYGYSIWELGVYGTPTTAPATTYVKSGTETLTYDAGSTATWASLTSQSTLPTGTNITYQARTSSNDSTWSAWNSTITSLAASRYIQIMATLTTTNTSVTPSLNVLTLNYSTAASTPTVTLSASPTSIVSGKSSTLTWSSTNATSCTASGSWSGTEGISGTATVAPTQTSSYGLSCTGTGGSITATPVTITVTTGTTAAYPLKVVGNTLESSNGNRFVIKGTAQYFYTYDDGGTPDTAMAGTSSTYYTNRDAWHQYMAAQGLNLVRVGVGAYNYDSQTYMSNANYETELGNIVTSASNSNLAVELGNWDSEGDALGAIYDYTLWHPYWLAQKSIINVHPNVIIEPFNEPNSMTNAQWLTMWESELQFWRGTGSGQMGYTGVIVVDTNNYSSDFTTSTIQSLMNYSNTLSTKGNLLFSIHSYATNWPTASAGFSTGINSGTTTNEQAFDNIYTTYESTYPMYVDETGNANGTQGDGDGDYNDASSATSPAAYPTDSHNYFKFLSQFNAAMATDVAQHGLNGETGFTFSWTQGDCMINYCYGNSPNGNPAVPVWNSNWGSIFESYYVAGVTAY